ncbi:MAG: AsmA family protein [Pseudomonadota bacterium]
MSKILRVLVMLIGTCILLALVAIIGLVVFVNPNDLKPQISQAVSNYTGRQLQLGGNIEWSLFPWLGLQLNGAKLSNTPGFGDKPFAQIQKLDIQVRLLPLLHKQLEVGKLFANGLTLYLVKDAQGRANWEGTRTIAQTPTTVPATSASNIPNYLKPLSFGVAGLDIQNGQLFFDDLQKNKHYEISQLQLKSANLTLNKSSPFSAKFNIKSNSPKLNALVKLSSDITLNINGKTVTLNKLNFDTVLKDPTYPKGELPISLRGNAIFNLNDQALASDKFTVTIAQNLFTGHIKGLNLFNSPAISGVLATDQYKFDKFTIQQVRLPFQFKNNALSLNPITGKLYQGNYQGNATIDLTTSTPRLITQGQLTQLNTQSLFQEFNSKSQIQLAGLANVNFNLTTQGSDTNTLLKNLRGQGQFNLDNGAIKGINLSYWVAMGKALLRHEPSPTSNTPDTPFNKFMGSFIIDKGILTNNDLNVISGRLRINGKGSVDLPLQQINYELNAQPVLSDGSPDGIAIPIKIAGQFNNIHITPILDKLSIDIVKEKLRGKLQEQLKKLDLKKIFQ